MADHMPASEETPKEVQRRPLPTMAGQKKWKKVIKAEDCWWLDQANKSKVSHPSRWDWRSYN